MITLSLDEFGNFELGNESSSPMGVAGILYDDCGDKRDTENERIRIEKYYRNCINSAKKAYSENENTFEKDFVFPQALHSDVGKLRNHEVVGRVKRTVNSTMQEFLREGTYNGKQLYDTPRKGKYFIFTIIKSNLGKHKLINPKCNFMVRDDSGSNLYYHMASQVINRLLFHNPILQVIDDISLNIATRRTEDIEENSKLANDYTRMGYRKNKNGEKIWFSVANADIYRSVISDEMIKSGKQSLNVSDYFVKSIDYYHSEKMEFLYLADSVCSFISNKIKGTDAGEWLTTVDNKAKALLLPDRNLIFGYDEIDVVFDRAWQAYEDGDYYSALFISYRAGLKKDCFSKYYRKWFSIISERILYSTDESWFTEAVYKLARTVKTNKYDPECMLFIFRHLVDMVNGIESCYDDTESKSIFYVLYSTGISVYCHIGDSKNALKYFEQCKQYVFSVGAEEYLILLNRIVAAFLDNFEWEDAERIANDVIDYQKALIDMKKNLPLFNAEGMDVSLELAKSFSQLGQVLAFKRSNACEDWFNKALAIMDDRSANYKITQSYLLHYYMDVQDEVKYRGLLSSYYDGKISLQDRLNYILQEAFNETPLYNYKYALYVFVRGLYLFEYDEVSNDLLDKLYDLDKTIKGVMAEVSDSDISIPAKMQGHPTELIYKYLALLAVKKGDNEMAMNYVGLMDEAVPQAGITIKALNMFSAIEIFAASKNEIEKNTMTDRLIDFLKDNFIALQGNALDSNASISEKMTWISGLFTYMYR